MEVFFVHREELTHRISGYDWQITVGRFRKAQALRIYKHM